MELTTILNRCHHFRGFVYQHARFSTDKRSIEVVLRPRKGSAAVCSRCHLPAPGYDQPAEPDGYGYSHFCELYERWRRKQELVLRQEHRPGEKMFVDWAGATIPIHDGAGAINSAPLFVSALGVSSYTYAEVTPNQQMDHWLKVQMHALEFYGGCPQLLVPDNTKTGVIKACRYEPDLNPTYQEFAAHYGVAVLPARPYKPRDKARWKAPYKWWSAGS